jgi:hypothetical protein
VNGKRIVFGGLAAGLVMAVLDAVTNAVLFKRDWADAYAALHLTPSDGALGGFWTTVDLVCGMLIAFLYAAMRPRLGAPEDRPRRGGHGLAAAPHGALVALRRRRLSAARPDRHGCARTRIGVDCGTRRRRNLRRRLGAPGMAGWYRAFAPER